MDRMSFKQAVAVKLSDAGRLKDFGRIPGSFDHCLDAAIRAADDLGIIPSVSELAAAVLSVFDGNKPFKPKQKKERRQAKPKVRYVVGSKAAGVTELGEVSLGAATKRELVAAGRSFAEDNPELEDVEGCAHDIASSILCTVTSAQDSYNVKWFTLVDAAADFVAEGMQKMRRAR